MTSHALTVLQSDNADDRLTLDELRADPGVTFLDTVDQQLDGLRALSPRPEPDVLEEPTRWVHYPWRRTVVHVLGPRGFRRLRLDRNRNLITLAEQERLNSLTVGVVGLSVGHSIAHTIAAEGVCGTLRLADFDDLELSNLNRVPATVFDLGVNKATAAARRIAELDPYLRVQGYPHGLTRASIAEFLEGLDVLVEECDSLDLKVLVRTAARDRGIPVLMATSDRGLFDVERFDSEPGRPLLHGLLGDVDLESLAGLASADKVPHVLRILDAGALSSRTAASLIEVGETLQTWPQRAGDVVVGAAAVVEAVRRIGLGETLRSGRIRVDVGAALDDVDDPAQRTAVAHMAESATEVEAQSLMETVAAAAVRAPSGGNAQPWHLLVVDDTLRLDVAPEHSSMMDVGMRGSAVALGAASFNARVAAAAHDHTATVEFAGDPHSPLRGTVRLSQDGTPDPALAALYTPMLRRETNRHIGSPAHIQPVDVAALQRAASDEGARVVFLSEPDQIETAATILAAADRIRFLSAELHAEMMSELRWPADPDPDAGIDVMSLELDAGKLAALEILRRSDVMAHLADWDAGTALGDDMAGRVRRCSSLAVVVVHGAELDDYARGGAAMQSVWIHAQDLGLAVQPVSPPFLYAQTSAELAALTPNFDAELALLKKSFDQLLRIEPGQSVVLVLRMGHVNTPASVRSRRRRLNLHSAERSA